jgi:hypothetical protein
MLLSALALSGVAAWFSVVGLMAIFAASQLSIAIMAGTLEVSKLVCASWLYNNWRQVPFFIKSYLTVAVVVLMVITSMGIFGYLSKAHLDQGVPTSDVAAQVALLDEKIKTERDNVDTAKKALTQMDAQVDQMLGRTDNDRGAERAVQIRRNQAKERATLQREIGDAQSKIAKLNEERAPIASELRKVEAEVGPIKYIAAMIYGDNPDSNTLERAVRWVTILLVSVFDPLAVIMLIAANFGLRAVRKEPEEVVAEPVVIPPTVIPDPSNISEVDQWNKMVEAAEAEAIKEHEENKQKELNEEMMNAPQFYPATEEDVEELSKATEASELAIRHVEPVAVATPVVEKAADTFQAIGDDYVQINGKTFSTPVYNSLKASGQLEHELAGAVLSASPIEGISLERVKELIDKIESNQVSVDDLTLPEREAIKKFLESDA